MPRSFPDRTSASILALASIAALTAPAAALPNAAPSRPDTVPTFVGEAAEISAADFVYALAEARIPAGFVGAYSDIFKDGGFQRSATLWRDRSREDRREMPLEAAINIFRSRQPRYDVEAREGLLLVHVRDIELSVGPLAKTAERFRVDGVPRPTAFNEAMRLVDQAIPVRGGVVGSLLGMPEETTPADRIGPLITLDVSNVTLLDVLNDIVRQAPGTVWMLLRHAEPPPAGHYTLAFRSAGGGITDFRDKLG
jgi:hypothetical protein